jgi:malate permease and related proteins
MDLLRLFADDLLPVFLVAVTGYALAAWARVDPRGISRVAFSVFAPSLIFQVIVDNRVPADALLRMVGFTLVVLLALAALAFAVVRAVGWPRPLASAVVLAVLLPNAGNLGLSTNLLAFGQPGLAQASLFFLTSSILTYTVGVFVASLGRASIGEALKGLVRVPAIWAVVVAFLMLRFDLALPGPAAKGVSMLAAACIPTFLVILGMQLRAAMRGAPVVPLLVTAGFRLIGGPALALFAAPAFGLVGTARQAGVLEASMPTAVICIILATEYDVEPGFVTSAVFLSTVLSPLTLTPLIAYLS